MCGVQLASLVIFLFIKHPLWFYLFFSLIFDAANSFFVLDVLDNENYMYTIYIKRWLMQWISMKRSEKFLLTLSVFWWQI